MPSPPCYVALKINAVSRWEPLAVAQLFSAVPLRGVSVRAALQQLMLPLKHLSHRGPSCGESDVSAQRGARGSRGAVTGTFRD